MYERLLWVYGTGLDVSFRVLQSGVFVFSRGTQGIEHDVHGLRDYFRYRGDGNPCGRGNKNISMR